MISALRMIAGAGRCQRKGEGNRVGAGGRWAGTVRAHSRNDLSAKMISALQMITGAGHQPSVNVR